MLSVHRVFLSFFLMAFCLLAVRAADGNQRFQTAMREGVALAQRGGRESNIRAIARYKEAIRINPRSAEARCRLALAYLDRGDYLAAEENAVKAMAIDSRRQLTWLVLGTAEMHLGKASAEKSLQTALQLNPQDAVTAYTLGRLHYFKALRQKEKRDGVNKALTFFKRAFELKSTYLPARFMIGCCWQELDMPALAYQEFDKLRRLQPENPDVLMRLAIASIQSETYMSAEKHLRDLLRLRPRSADAYLMLGDLFQLHLDNAQEALLNYARFVQYAPRHHGEIARVEALLEADRQKRAQQAK